MLKLISFAIALALSTHAHAFLLTDANYRLARPEKTEVNIAAGSCVSNGMSTTELSGAINEVLDKYWNTVTESRLKIKYGGEVNRPISGQANSGEILVGCYPLGLSGPSGAAFPDTSNGSARVMINSNTMIPGNYYYAGLVGLLAHEMGHAIGLHHSGDAASIMTYESHSWGPTAKHLAQDDKDGIVYLYPNPEAALGLLGSCGAIASTDRSPRARGVSPWAYFLELALLLFSGYLAQASLTFARAVAGIKRSPTND